MKKTIFGIAMVLSVSLISCKSDGDNIGFDDVPADSIQSVQVSIDKSVGDTTKSGFATSASAESQRAIWLKIFETCYESNSMGKNDIFNTSLLFFGPSSNMYLGTVVDKKLLNNNFDVKTELKYLIPASDFKQFSTVGENVNNCDLTKVTDKEFNMDLFLTGVVAQGMNDSVGLKISHWDSVKVLSGQWQIDYIRESDFVRYLNKNKSNPDIAYYRDVVFNRKNRIATKVIKVSGFSANAFYKDTLSAGIQAALSNPVTVKVVNNNDEVSKTDSISAKVTFRKASSTSVNISSSNSFYIFGNVKKGKRL